MSVATQITLNDGDTQGLYRGAVMVGSVSTSHIERYTKELLIALWYFFSCEA